MIDASPRQPALDRTTHTPSEPTAPLAYRRYSNRGVFPLADGPGCGDDGRVFGRKKDEGGIPGLSSLSGGPTASTRPTGIPGTEASASDAHTSASMHAGEAQAGPQLGASTAEPWEIGPWTIRLFVVAFFAAFAVLFSAEEERRMNDPVEKASRGELTPASRESMLKTANLRRALNAVKAQSPAGATVESMRIEPARVDIKVARRDGSQIEFSVDPSFSVDKDDYPASEPQGIPFSRVPVGVPERLIRTIEAKLKLRPANLDYLLLNTRVSSIDGKRDDSWGAYYSKPPLNNDATAALNGTDVRLIGTPDAASRAQMRKGALDALRNLERSERQIKAMDFPSKAMREQSLKNIRDAMAQQRKTLKEIGQ